MSMPLVSRAQTTASGEVNLVSDYVFRGVSQTLSAPALQASVSVETGRGWYASLWASNVDFTDSGDPDDGARIEVDIEVGLSQPLGERLTANLALSRYAYPGATPAYDYNEWLATLSLDDSSYVTVAYSNDVFASGTTGVAYLLGTETALPAGLRFGVELGYYALASDYSRDYRYAQLAIGGNLSDVHWQLAYFALDARPTELFPAATVSNRIVLGLGTTF